MAIDYGYLYNKSMDMGGPNRAFRDAFIRNPGEVTRLANQDEQGFYAKYGRPTQQPQSIQPTTRPQEALQPPQATPVATQPQSPFLGPSGGLGEGFGGMGGDNFSNPVGGGSNFSSPIGGNNFEGLLGKNPGMRDLTSMGAGMAGLEGGGLLANALFGDQRSMMQAGLGYGLGKLAEKSNVPVLGSLIGPGMKLASGGTLGIEDAIRFAANFHPATRTAKAIYDLGSTLHGLYKGWDQKNKRNQAFEDDENLREQYAFEDIKEPTYASQEESHNQPTLESIYSNPEVMTTENTYDTNPMGGYAEQVQDHNIALGGYDVGYDYGGNDSGLGGGGWDGGRDPGSYGVG